MVPRRAHSPCERTIPPPESASPARPIRGIPAVFLSKTPNKPGARPIDLRSKCARPPLFGPAVESTEASAPSHSVRYIEHAHLTCAGHTTMNTDSHDPESVDAAPPTPHGAAASNCDRRDLLRRGVKLAFVAPMVLTFSARDAMAAGSNHSCYPAGQPCPGEEECCNGPCNFGVCP